MTDLNTKNNFTDEVLGYDPPTDVNDLQKHLWFQWIERLLKEQKDPRMERYEISTSDKDVLKQAISGDWDAAIMSIEDSNIDWLQDQNDHDRKYFFETEAFDSKKEIAKYVESLSDEECEDWDEQEFLSQTYELFDDHISEDHSDLLSGYVYSDYSFTGRADICFDVDHKGAGNDEFEVIENDFGVCLMPTKKLLGFINILNIDFDVFLDAWLKNAGNLEEEIWFKGEFERSKKSFIKYHGNAYVVSSRPPAISAEGLCDWLQARLESCSHKDGFGSDGWSITLSMNGSDLTEMAEGMAYANGNTVEFGSVAAQYLHKSIIGPGAELICKGESFCGEPLVLTGPLMISPFFGVSIDENYSGSKSDIEMLSVNKERSRRELIEKLQAKDFKMSDIWVKNILKKSDITTFWLNNLSEDVREKLKFQMNKFEISARSFDYSDIEFPISTEFLCFLKTDDGKMWCAPNGDSAFQCLINALPVLDALRLAIKNDLPINIKNSVGDTPLHALFRMYSVADIANDYKYRDKNTLLEGGLKPGDLEIKNDANETPLELIIKRFHNGAKDISRAAITEALIEKMNEFGYDWWDKKYSPNDVYDKKLSLANLFNIQDHPVCVSQRLKQSIGIEKNVAQPKNSVL